MKLLIAAPHEVFPGGDFDLTQDAQNFFQQDPGVTCFVSMNPADIAQADGVVVPGGLPDVHPQYWRGAPLDLCHYDPALDEAQLAMIQRAVELHRPLFGICRGYQLISAYFGAELAQDLIQKEFHRFDPEHPKFHIAYQLPGTAFYEKLGPMAVINSLHHQGLCRLPEDLLPAQLWAPDADTAARYLQQAQAGALREVPEDCVIEGVEHRTYPFVGVEWHPEMQGAFFCKDLDLRAVRALFYRHIPSAPNGG